MGNGLTVFQRCLPAFVSAEFQISPLNSKEHISVVKKLCGREGVSPDLIVVLGLTAKLLRSPFQDTNLFRISTVLLDIMEQFPDVKKRVGEVECEAWNRLQGVAASLGRL